MMKKITLSLILCLWAASAWAFPPGFIGSITQNATGGTSTVVLSDAFDEASDTALASHPPNTGGTWVTATGTWTVVGGAGWVKKAADTSTVIYPVYNQTSSTITDFSATATVRWLYAANSGLGNGICRLDTNRSGYCAYLLQNGGSPYTLSIRKFTNGSDAGILVSSSTTITGSTSDRHLTFTAVGATLTATVTDDNTTITWNDSTYSSGYPGICMRGADNYIKTVEFTE